MPCIDDYPPTPPKSWKPELDEVTALLCEACDVIDSLSNKPEMSESLACWWIEHKKADKKRIDRDLKNAEQEALKMKAAYDNAQARLKDLKEEEKTIKKRKG